MKKNKLINLPITDYNDGLMKLGYSQFRKKPLIIWAKQMDTNFEVFTKEGKMQGEVGDYLIIGIEGELYPCKKEIFEKSYDRLQKNQE